MHAATPLAGARIIAPPIAPCQWTDRIFVSTSHFILQWRHVLGGVDERLERERRRRRRVAVGEGEEGLEWLEGMRGGGSEACGWLVSGWAV